MFARRALFLKGPGILRRLWSAREGAGMIEFALAAPVLLMALAAVIELAMIVGVNALLTWGMHEASRLDFTSGANLAASHERRIAQRITESAFGIIDPGDVAITAEVYDDNGPVGALRALVETNVANRARASGEPSTGADANGRESMDPSGAAANGGVIVYTATLAWPLITPLLDRMIGADGKVLLLARMTVENGPRAVAEATDGEG
jgi:Flp pilus assembly protein TadG